MQYENLFIALGLLAAFLVGCGFGASLDTPQPHCECGPCVCPATEPCLCPECPECVSCYDWLFGNGSAAAVEVEQVCNCTALCGGLTLQ